MIAIRSVFLLTLLVVLIGCAEFDKGGLLDVGPVTPTTAWTDANARYSERLRTARDYARRCQTDLAMVRSDCQDTIDDLNRIDMRAEAIQVDGDAALGRQDLRRLADAIDGLDETGTDIDRTLALGQARPGSTGDRP